MGLTAGLSDGASPRDEIERLIARLESTHADRVYLGKEYTKADLIRDLRKIRSRSGEGGRS